MVTLASGACGGARGSGHAAAPPAAGTRVTGEGRPSLAVVLREGDARGALAVAVTTEGIAPERGAVPGVALAALVEARLAARGVSEVSAVGGWGGWRLRVLFPSASPGETAKVVDGVRAAMLTPIVADEPALAAVARKVAALGRRPLADRVLVDVAECTGEAYGTGGDAPPGTGELETWRRAAHGLGRVAIATAGDGAFADQAATALARAPVWPAAAPARTTPGVAADARAVVYDGSGEIAPGGARVVVTARTARPEQAVAAAPALGDPRGPLASRLAALDAPARVTSVVATAHGDGGCVAATLELAARDLAADAPARIATAAALARQELAVELGDAVATPDLGRVLATRAADPRDAAERAAWWGLAGRRGGPDQEPRLALTVGVSATRDAGGPGVAAAADAIRAEIDRATIAWHAPVVETRTHVEHGQGEAWVLLASTCGTVGESSSDAGSGAVMATAAAAQASGDAGDARVEPFVASDGVGVLAHGPARAGESPAAHARRLADLAARAFAADALSAEGVDRARSSLLARVGDLDVRALGALGGALAPGHPSWIEPLGTTFGLASASGDAVALRVSSSRSGPLRVAVLADVDQAQAEVAARAVDRWIARRPGEVRACPPLATSSRRSGTYAVDLPAGAPSEVLLAVPLPPDDDAARSAATWLAAVLDGGDGLLARALGPTHPDAADAALARAWSAAVVGAPRSPALVLRIVADDASLDGAVAQTRALLDRLRQGALREDDRARAASSLARASLAVSLDPRARTIELWRGDPASPAPSLDALRAFAASMLRDDALVIVAARPPRLDPAGRPFPGRETRAKNREQVPPH
ncbi:MAG TPA: hypothetical protein VIF15_19850 [Polyangiaceae bacterium]